MPKFSKTKKNMLKKITLQKNNYPFLFSSLTFPPDLRLSPSLPPDLRIPPNLCGSAPRL